MEKLPSRLARSHLFQVRSRQPGQPACPYKRTVIFTIKITTQQDLAYRTVSLSGPARLPYKQALNIPHQACRGKLEDKEILCFQLNIPVSRGNLETKAYAWVMTNT
jgi:hypothetical protein